MTWKHVLWVSVIGFAVAFGALLIWGDSPISWTVSIVAVVIMIGARHAARRNAPDPEDIPVSRQKWGVAVFGLLGLAMIGYGIWMLVALGPDAYLTSRRPVIVFGPLAIAAGACSLWLVGHLLRRIRSR